MTYNLRHILLGYNWHLKNDKAWFLSTVRSDLFEVDFFNETLEYLSQVPSSEASWGHSSTCFKQDDYIFCFPIYGAHISKFDTIKYKWKQIPIVMGKKMPLIAEQYWIMRRNVFLYARGINSIIEFDSHSDYIVGVSELPTERGERLGLAVKHEDNIYIVSNSRPMIYKFNMADKSIRKIYIDLKDVKLWTICYDGKFFWLTGFGKNLYRWDETSGSVQIFHTPSNFGRYCFDKSDRNLYCGSSAYNGPAFQGSFKVGEYIWFIPSQTNSILFIDAYGNVHPFPIEEDVESFYTLERAVPHIYFIQYVRDERYIGLFSCKNEWSVEIDAVDLTYKIRSYSVTEDTKSHICETLSDVWSETYTPGYSLVSMSSLIDDVDGKVHPNGTLKREIDSLKWQESSSHGESIYHFML